MLSYGLFLSKLNANGHSLNLNNAKQYIPKSFKLIQEFVGFLDVLDADYYRDVRWVVDEIVSIINGLDVLSVKNDLSFRNRKRTSSKLTARDEEEWRLFSRDPFIYFYEDYLAKYDANLRKSRGVYYTPPPVVNFIVRAIDDILKSDFDLKTGLADHNKLRCWNLPAVQVRSW
jgi:type I restriction-modification system DNA methylase subunit